MYKTRVLALCAKLPFTSGIPPTTSGPLFELVILFRQYVFPMTGPATIITEEDRSHESTLAEFLTMAPSPTICETLLSTLPFARAEADADLFSSTYLRTSIMQYAECITKIFVYIADLVKLKVEAIIIDDATPVAEGITHLDPHLYMIYWLTSVPSLHHSPLTMIDSAETGDCCAVCLEDFRLDEKVASMSCCHYFHQHCIVKWLFQQGNCPTCRNSDMVDLDSDSDL